jgi:asparagine synthase (glutamine-hydrolysing)
VPLGAFLSGGVDSSLIVAVMGRDLKRDNLNTFSAGFRAKSYDESGQARAVARFLGVHHHDETIEADGLAELPMLMRRAGEPFADNSLMPTYHLSALARRHVTVSLSGDGGDELFAGYDTYLADRLHRAAGVLPKPVLDLAAGAISALLPVSFAKVSFDYKLRQFLAARGSDAARAHYSWRTLFDAAEARTLLHSGRGAEESDPYLSFKHFYDELAGCHDLDRAAYVDIKTWLVDDILVKVDRASMAHGLEARAPFLDHRLVEFAASLAPDLKLRGLRTKHLLKRLHRQYLPARLLARRKRGFNAPVSIWLGAKGADAARAFTSSSSVLDWVDRSSVDRLWADHVAGRRDNGYRLFAIACFGAWLESRVQDRAVPASRKESHLAH